MESPEREVVDVSPMRRVVVDIGTVAGRRHAIQAWFSCDVTDVLPRLGSRHGVGVTAYVVASLARVVAAHPHVHGMRDLRGRVHLARSVDVNVIVEVEIDGEPFPMNHVLRDAASRDAAALHDEMHRVRAAPTTSDTTRLAQGGRWYVRLPGPARRGLMRLVQRVPSVRQRLMGTVGVTSVGMFGRGDGVGLPYLVHSLDVLVGGTEDRVALRPDGRPETRQRLWIALVADHDVVDGAPLARFVTAFRDALESGIALDGPGGTPDGQR